MLLDVIKFEIKYWLNRPITYVFPVIVLLLAYASFTVDNISLGGELAFRNSPSTLIIVYMMIFFFLPLFTSSFVSSSISRDFENDFSQILYSLPINRFQLLMGRFLGGLFMVSTIFLGIALADVLAGFTPWVADNVIGPFHGMVHVQYYFLFVIPNVFLVGAILFSVTAWTKNNNAAFLTAIAIIVSYLTFLKLGQKLDNKFIAGLLDPFGIVASKIQTDKWTAFEKNNNILQLTFNILCNRVLWVAIGGLLWTIAYKTFSIDVKKGSGKKEELDTAFKAIEIAKIIPQFTFISTLINIKNQSLTDYRNIIRSSSFVVVIGLMLMMLVLQLVGAIQMDDATQLATTLNTIQYLSVISTVLSISMIFFAGILIWKERDAKMNDIYDALPHKTGSAYLGKLISLILIIWSFYIFLIGMGCLYQIIKGNEAIEFDLYFKHFFLLDFLDTFSIAVFAVFLQVMINNKYIAYFISGTLLLTEDIAFSYFEWKSKLIGISPSLPEHTYSDFYGYGPYTKGLFGFGLYWALLYTLIGIVAYLFYKRGHQNLWKDRFKEAKIRLKSISIFSLLILVSFLSWGGYLYYQTQIKNTYLSIKEEKKRKALYEVKFEKYSKMEMPSVIDVDYTIDLFPEERKYEVNGKMIMINKTNQNISTIYLNNKMDFKFEIQIPNSKLQSEDNSTIRNFQIYTLETPMKPGDTINLSYRYHEFYEGIENELNNQRLLPNGSFLDFDDFTPIIGYDNRMELDDKKDREKNNLPLKTDRMDELKRDCGKACMKDYIGGMGDWVNVHTTISTSNDQIAIAPGSLQKKWKKDNRNYFEYQLDHPSKFFFTIVSGKYNIAVDSTNGIRCEVYYHPTHSRNVKEMMLSLKNSIAYYTKEFGPYYHKQARIIEFPRFSSFAQAFPGTMPYSESIGFTVDIENNKNDINEVCHVVSHEMAHQWWAHQVTGANVKGSTILSESLAEYSSLKIIEHQYGMDMVVKFLKESNNDYIFGRARETKKEANLINMESDQSYLHYNKGSVILYGIQQVLGEAKFNQLLRNIIEQYAYREPPYPTSYALYDRILENCPDSLRYLVHDGLDSIIVYKNEILEAKTKALNNGKFETTVKFVIVKNASDPNAKVTSDLNNILLGQSIEIPVNNDLDIALFDKEKGSKRYGNPILMKRLKIDKKENTFTFVTDSKPYKFVLDPYFINIHKDPVENIKIIN